MPQRANLLAGRPPKQQAEQRKFLRSRVRRLWQAASNPMPIESAREVLAMFDNGHLRVRGGIIGANFDVEQRAFRVRFLDPVPTNDRTCSNCDAKSQHQGTHPPTEVELKFDVVINAMGVGLDIEKATNKIGDGRGASTLLSQLVSDGWSTGYFWRGIAWCLLTVAHS